MTWPIASLESLAAPFKGSITDGPFGSNLARRHYRDSGPLVVRLQNIGDGAFIDSPAHIDFDHFENLRKHEVLPGDLLVASLGEVLPRACLAPSNLGPAIVKADCIRVRLREDVDSRWVNYALQRPSVRKWAEQHRHGVGRPRLGLKGIRQIPIPIPAITEQARIVELLEDHLSHLDAAAGEVLRAGTRLDALVLATLRLHVTEMEGRSTHFERIGNLAATSLGKMLDAKKATGEPTPYLANVNVRWGRFDLDHLKSVPLTADERARLTMEPGDVIVCEGGEPGRCAVWDRANTGIAYQKALHRVRVHDSSRIAPEYLALMIREAIQSGRADRLFTGTTIKHLPQEKLRMLEIPVPDRSVQLATLAEVGAVSRAAKRLDALLGAASARGDALRRAVIVSAFDGKLTGRHTDTEVIEELAYA